VFLETRAVRRRQIAKQAEERRSEQKQRLAESCALFRLPIEVQMIIYVYAMSGNGGVIYVDWQRGPSLKYYSETFYECSKLWQQRSDGNSDPAVQVACDAIDKAIEKGALYYINGDIVLPRISDEHISTVRSLCTLARDTWSDLLFAANKWELHRANEITLFLTDIGESGRLGVRHLKINVTTRGEAHHLQQVMQFTELQTLFVSIPHSVKVHAVTPPWRGLTYLALLSHLKRLKYYKVGCAQKCNSCLPCGDLARKELYEQ